MVAGRKQPPGDLIADRFCAAKPRPEILGTRETHELALDARYEIVLDDAVAVRGIGELEPENLRVFFCLLQPVAWRPVRGLRLHDSQREIPAVSQKIVRAFLRPSDRTRSRDND